MNEFKLPAVTQTQMVEIDRLMIEDYGISLLQMMENAGLGSAELSRETLNGELKNKTIAVLCGGGNNGGGGMAAARHLSNWGAQVVISLAVPRGRLKEAAEHQLHTLYKMGIPISENFPVGSFDLVIDALIGYGLHGAPRGKIAQWIDQANQNTVPILSLDIPSGLDADSGTTAGACIHAAVTLTLALPKIGMLKEMASSFVGKLYVGDISVPLSLYEKMSITADYLFASHAYVRLN